MLGPIPNSLTAGAYNGSFIPHGLVTFSTRVAVEISQKICVEGESVTVHVLNAVMTAQQALDAGYIDRIPLDGEVITTTGIEGMVVTVQALTGLIEEC